MKFEPIEGKDFDLILKPCPFCGGEGAFDQPIEGEFHVTCNACYASTGWGSSRLEVSEFWNRRTSHPSIK